MKPTVTYALTEFSPAVAPKAIKKPAAMSRPTLVAPTSVPDVASPELSALSDECRAIIVQGARLDDPEHYPSRSEAVFSVACAMVRERFDREAIAAVLLNPDFKISEHVREKEPRAEAYALRQADRAAEAVNSDFEYDGSKPPKIIRNSQHNIRVALSKMNVELRYNIHWSRVIVNGFSDIDQIIDDQILNALWLKIDDTFHFRPQSEFFAKVVQNEALVRPFHPVLDCLNGQQWDGVNRIDGWLTAYCGAEDKPYTRAVGALLLIAAVRRVRQPGVKFDEMVVLEGEQGSGKSSALRIMAVQEEWVH